MSKRYTFVAVASERFQKNLNGLVALPPRPMYVATMGAAARCSCAYQGRRPLVR